MPIITISGFFVLTGDRKIGSPIGREMDRSGDGSLNQMQRIVQGRESSDFLHKRVSLASEKNHDYHNAYAQSTIGCVRLAWNAKDFRSTKRLVNETGEHS